MKLTVTGSDLNAATSWAARIVPTHPGVPILSGLLLDATEGQLSITAFDYDTRGTSTVAADTATPGRVVVSGRLLAAIAKAATKSAHITITVDGPTVTVQAGRSEWTLPTMPADDFPGLPQLGDPIGEIDADVLRRTLPRVTTAIGADPTVPALTGVKLDGDDTGLTLAATDRFRVASATVAWKPATTTTVSALLAPELLNAAARAAGSGTVAVFHSDSTFGFSTDTHHIVGRRISAEFPNLARVTPTPCDHYTIIDVAELAHAVNNAAVMLDRAPILELAFTTDTVRVRAIGDGTQAETHTSGDLTGDPTTFGINARYLTAALNAMETDRATIHFADRVILMLPEGDDEYHHVICKVKLPE